MKLTPLFDNCEKTAIRIIRIQKINITASTVTKNLRSHPDYPSLLSISDFLNNYKIENLALKTEIGNFFNFPLPFIAHITDEITNEKKFSIIKQIRKNENEIIYEVPGETKDIKESTGKFKKKFNGYVLLLDSSQAVQEIDYNSKRNKEKKEKFIDKCILIFLPVLIIVYTIFLFKEYSLSHIIFPIIFLLLTLLGLTVSFLLLLYEVDNRNLLIKNICHIGKKLNCSAVLQSRASGIKNISWSSIGFTYFFGMIFALLTFGLKSASVLFVLGCLSLCAIPYIFFSVYYQWKIVKQWCILCLTIQLILATQCATCILGDFFNNGDTNVSFQNFIGIVSCFIFPSFALYIILPALKNSKKNRIYYYRLQRLKYNKSVFESILNKQKAIRNPTIGLGISFGNPNAKFKIIKVCNPYCRPCAQVHATIEELAQAVPDIQVQIIFTASGRDDDLRTPPVRHFLAIASITNEASIRNALNEWYNMPQKDYEVFAAKFPIGFEKDHQNEKIKAMKNWCESEQISFTPTLFINGFQMPDIYNAEDLKFFLNT